jgi:hypothetical protein
MVVFLPTVDHVNIVSMNHFVLGNGEQFALLINCFCFRDCNFSMITKVEFMKIRFTEAFSMAS